MFYHVIEMHGVECTNCKGHSWFLPPRSEEEFEALKCGFCDLKVSEMKFEEPETQEEKVEEVQLEQIEEPKSKEEEKDGEIDQDMGSEPG